MIRHHLLAVVSGLLVVTGSLKAHGRPKLGGAHVAYTVGGSLAQQNAGLRQGLDLALMPVLFCTTHRSARDSYSTDEGYTAGASGIIGFGTTPSYVALDFGRGVFSVLGAFAGVGAVYRFPSAEMSRGVGVEGRANLDVMLLNLGLRLMLIGGDESSEAVLLANLGLGRF